MICLFVLMQPVSAPKKTGINIQCSLCLCTLMAFLDLHRTTLLMVILFVHPQRVS